MAASDLPPGGCDLCQQGVDHPEREMHRQTIALLSRLDENQRRWFVAHEAQRLGYGGDRLLAQITGMDEKTIRRGHTELVALLVGQPSMACGHRVVAGHRLKKRPSARTGPNGSGGAGNRGRPDEWPEMGAQ
jgi:hypothetical protein